MDPVVISPDELAEVLAEPQNHQELLGNKERLKAFAEAYAKDAVRKGSLVKEIKAQFQETMTEFVKEHGLKRLPMGVDPNDAVPGAGMDGKFKSMGEFIRAIHPHVGKGADPRLKTLEESQGETGGFLVPEEFRANLLMLALEAAIVRPRATVIPISTASVLMPMLDVTSHASNLYGGVVAYWIPESGTFTASEPDFGQTRLTAKKLTGLTVASNELLSDAAISLEALINTLFPRAIAFEEDVAFIRGDGAGEPVGILNADCLVSQAKETGQAADTIVWENIVKMYSRMFPSSLGRAVWLAHIDTFPQLATMSLSIGTGGSAIWLNNGAAGPPMTILGRPVIFTEKCETVGTVGDIYFADFSYYLIADRQTLSMTASPHVYFTTDRTAYRFVERVDGQPWIRSAITPKRGSTTLSGFVALASRD